MYDYNSMKKEFIEEFNKYGITEKDHKFKRIYNKYLNNCIVFQNLVKGNLDTFKKVSCLMDAIVQKPIVKKAEENDKIALDIGLSLIEKPTKYEGKNYDEEYKLDEVSMQLLKEETYFWEIHYQGMLDSIKYDRQEFRSINLLSIANVLELTYKCALEKTNVEKELGKVKCKK